MMVDGVPLVVIAAAGSFHVQTATARPLLLGCSAVKKRRSERDGRFAPRFQTTKSLDALLETAEEGRSGETEFVYAKDTASSCGWLA